MIINKDLTDILYSFKCLDCQRFCVSFSLFTDQKIQKVIPPFSPMSSAHSCLKSYRNIYAKNVRFFSCKEELILGGSVVWHVKKVLYKICVQKSIIILVFKCQHISTCSYLTCICRFNN